MPQNDGEVRVEITGDSSKIKKELKETETAVQHTTEKVSEMFSALNYGKTSVFKEVAEDVEDAGKAATDATHEMDNLGDSIEDAGQKTVTFGDLLKANILSDAIQKGISKLTDGFVGFIQKGVDLASRLQEVQNVVDTTFGDGADQIYEWADAAAESFGMSSLQAQNFNGTLGAMLKSMGLTDDAVLKMSTDMVGLAGDMASFYNIDIEQAFEKIRSGISGETEPLKQLGINMSVANLEAYALSQGIETAYEKMSQSEQAILRYNYLMSVTADAQGDFARTSDSFANQQRILQLQTENLAASFGEKLLPSLNNVLSTANDKLPRLENTIENVGKVLGVVTEFALDNHEAILGLITAYASFQGVSKAGNFISGLVTAFKQLLPATKAATAAQQANNAAAAANPYVLLASAVAALTVGLIAYANSLDNVHNRIKDVNNDVKELKKNTEESISSSEAEIAVFRDKAAQYEELREKASRTAGEEERLKQLAEELQGYMPESTRLINEQTGAYESLASSVGSVSEAMRRRATVAAYEDEYTEQIKKQLEAQKNLEEAQKEYDEKYGKYGAFTDIRLKRDLNGAQEAYDEVEARLKELDGLINQLYEDSAETSKKIGNLDFTTDPFGNKPGEGYGEKQTLEEYEQYLQNYKDTLDKNLKLRKIDEDKYYALLSNRLRERKNEESELYFNLLGETEKYYSKKAEAADKAADKQLQTEKYAAEKLQKEADAAAKKAQREAEAAAKKAEQEAKKLYTEQENIVKKSLKNIQEQFKKAYDELEKKRENYKKKLLSIGGDLFSVEEIEQPDGTKTKQYTVNDIDKQMKQLREYHAAVSKLKKEGASTALLSELTSLNDADSQQFAKYLSNMSEEEFAKINELYSEKEKLAEELSRELYADEYKAISDGVNTALDAVSAGASDKGKAAAEAYAEAFRAELLELSEDFYPLLGDEKYSKWFGSSTDFPNIFDGNAGKLMKMFSGVDFSGIISEVMTTVRTEQARYSAAAYTAPVPAASSQGPAENKKQSDIEDILRKLNKPVQLVLDRKTIAEAVLSYSGEVMRKTGG